MTESVVWKLHSSAIHDDSLRSSARILCMAGNTELWRSVDELDLSASFRTCATTYGLKIAPGPLSMPCTSRKRWRTAALRVAARSTLSMYLWMNLAPVLAG